MLGGATLVDGDGVVEPEDVADGIGQAIEALAPSVGVVGHHHGGELIVAHGVRAAVRQHVQEDIPGPEKKGVVARLLHSLEPTCRGLKG